MNSYRFIAICMVTGKTRFFAEYAPDMQSAIADLQSQFPFYDGWQQC